MKIECTPAMADALRKIFASENVPYSLGYGTACIVYIIESKDVKRAKKAIAEWKDAIDTISRQIKIEDARESDRAWRRSQE